MEVFTRGLVMWGGAIELCVAAVVGVVVGAGIFHPPRGWSSSGTELKPL